MRAESDITPPTRRDGRLGRNLRVVVIVLVAALILLLLSLRGIADYYTDYLWFDALDLSGVWSEILVTKIVLAVFFIGIFAALMWLNLYVADRLAPEFRAPGPEEELVARYHELVGRRTGLVRGAVTVLFAISVGAGASSQWEEWLLFSNQVDFGIDDPHFGRDIGFFVFRLPFLTYVVDWLFTAALIVLVITAAFHYLNGGIRIQTPGERVAPAVKGHLSVLLALLALVKAADYWLDRFDLTVSSNGEVDGLLYTDLNARLPVLNLLILISLFAVALLILNIRRRGWVLPALAVGLWAFVNVIMGGIYPLVIQRFTVEPDESTKEALFIERNISATRDAFGLNIDNRDFEFETSLTGDDLIANADILRNVPLLDPSIVSAAYRLEQADSFFFSFPTELDVDRYNVNGELTPVTIGARGLSLSNVSDTSWESQTLTYTHGNGVALAPANDIVDDLPVYLIGDVPQTNLIEDTVPIEEPRLYYGENLRGYSIAASGRVEVDLIDDREGQVGYSYEGEGGVEAGGFFRRAAFSLRFRSIDPLISDFVTDDSRVLYYRDVGERVRQIAPFLSYDHDPYPVIVDGRISYVIDAYTTSTKYPYSQRAITDQLDNGSGLRRNFNYVRNSVKAVVDGFDGHVDFYIVDESDPIVAAWALAFPNIFSPASEMPAELTEHLRYPEDIFTVQTNMWTRWRIDGSDEFYDRASEWAVAPDPGGVEGPASVVLTSEEGEQSRRETRIDPYYTLLRLPGETESSFVTVRSFVPASDDDFRKEMTSLMFGVSDMNDGSYGRLVQYDMRSTEVLGPSLVAANVLNQEEISEEISLLNAKDEGSRVAFGDLIVVPIEQSLLYVRPMYVIASGTELPALEWIVLAYGDQVVMCHGLSQAIEVMFGVQVPGVQRAVDSECIGDTVSALASIPPTTSSPTPTSPNTEPPAPLSGDAAADALSLLEQADAALKAGDLGRYQELVDQARGLLEGSVGLGEPGDTIETPADDPDAEDSGADDAEDEGDPA